ncbi:hypothetical protein AMECASPLE_013366 [Ameca splendens]|uniref:Secreted protein n=1 Tax=Ameca splendens TaxID=208324 RepID=A0ABV0YC83_9TELE
MVSKARAGLRRKIHSFVRLLPFKVLIALIMGTFLTRVRPCCPSPTCFCTPHVISQVYHKISCLESRGVDTKGVTPITVIKAVLSESTFSVPRGRSVGQQAAVTT